MNKIESAFDLNFRKADKHKTRIEIVSKKIIGFMPLDENTIVNLTDEQIEKLDQFLLRFSSLQDILGRNLFKLSLMRLGEDVAQKSFIDVFNRLEQLGIIKNYELWSELRTIRNEVAHDYEDSPKHNAEKLNGMFAKRYELLQYFYDIKNYFGL
ncbi:MAG: hypothetical protein V1773_05925 [bacterium]